MFACCRLPQPLPRSVYKVQPWGLVRTLNTLLADCHLTRLPLVVCCTAISIAMQRNDSTRHNGGKIILLTSKEIYHHYFKTFEATTSQLFPWRPGKVVCEDHEKPMVWDECWRHWNYGQHGDLCYRLYTIRQIQLVRL